MEFTRIWFFATSNAWVRKPPTGGSALAGEVDGGAVSEPLDISARHRAGTLGRQEGTAVALAPGEATRLKSHDFRGQAQSGSE
jgi:hypothetical protein